MNINFVNKWQIKCNYYDSSFGGSSAEITETKVILKKNDFCYEIRI